MKKISLFLVCLFSLSVLFSSCSKSDDAQIESVVRSFYKHIENKEWDKAAKLGTEGTKKLLKLTEAASALVNTEAPKTEVKSVAVAVNGDKAKATVVYIENGKEKTEILSLVKEGGSWLVDLVGL